MIAIGVVALLFAACDGDSEALDTSTVPASSPTAPGIAASVACGHAHNDYEHDRPLSDALEHGFCSLEADIWLQPEGLLVAHDLADVDPARTLQSLYLDPLHRWIEGNGMPYEDGPLILLVDVKSESADTYESLHAVLERYADILTVFEDGRITEGAVTIVVSGNRDRTAMEAQGLRYAALDGRLEDLGGGAPIDLIPLISANWQSEFGWSGSEPMAAATRDELRALVAAVHDEGRRIRFWAIPDSDIGWAEMADAGVDLINTDHIANLASFLDQSR